MKRIGGDESNVGALEHNRVSKKKFISAIAKRTGYPVRAVTAIYDAALEELMSVVKRGDQLMLTGFGRFYGQRHKGHRVQFGVEGEKRIKDYSVLKFSSVRAINQQLDESDENPEVEQSQLAVVAKR